MKKNAKPELAPKWWKDNKPKAWSDKGLETALAAYAKGLASLEKLKTEDAFESASDLLDDVEKEAEASEKVAGQKPKKEPKDYDADDFKNTAEVLKKFGSYVKLERKKLEDLVEEEEDDDNKITALLKDEDAYQKYLKKTMKRLQNKAYTFALALAKPSEPQNHRFLFHKTKSGKKLGKLITDNTDLEKKKHTFGTAGADPQDGETLVLALDYKQLPGMEKHCKKFLLKFKPLPFSKVKLVSAETGEVLPDIPDPEDTEQDEAPAIGDLLDPQAQKWKQGLKLVTPKVKAAIAKQQGDVSKIRAVLGYAREKAEGKDYAAALKSLVALSKLLDEAAASAGEDLAGWRKASKNAQFQLRRLQFALRTYAQELNGQLKSAGGDSATKLRGALKGSLQIAEMLDQVVDKISVEPTSSTEIDELQTFLKSDKTVQAAEKPNPFKLTVDITGPLIDELEKLQPSLAEVG